MPRSWPWLDARTVDPDPCKCLHERKFAGGILQASIGIHMGMTERRTGALGWLTFTGDGPDRFIRLSRASAEELLRSKPGLNDPTISSHEASIGRALGRALAHELDHYVLRSKVHTRRGLMRAVWTSDQTFALFRDGFGLTSQERSTAADNVRMELACSGSAP
jgi:hypothetical protein